MVESSVTPPPPMQIRPLPAEIHLVVDVPRALALVRLEHVLMVHLRMACAQMGPSRRRPVDDWRRWDILPSMYAARRAEVELFKILCWFLVILSILKQPWSMVCRIMRESFEFLVCRSM